MDKSENILNDWGRILATLWVAYDKPVDPERFRIYKNQLARLPLGLLEAVVNRAIRNHQYNTVPTLGDVWMAAKAELLAAGCHNADCDVDAAIEQWQDLQFARIVYRF